MRKKVAIEGLYHIRQKRQRSCYFIYYLSKMVMIYADNCCISPYIMQSIQLDQTDRRILELLQTEAGH